VTSKEQAEEMSLQLIEGLGQSFVARDRVKDSQSTFP